MMIFLHFNKTILNININYNNNINNNDDNNNNINNHLDLLILD